MVLKRQFIVGKGSDTMASSQEGNEVVFGTTMCRRDIHYGRALLASVNYFYPNHPIKVICALDVTRAERAELSEFPNVEVFSVGELIDKYKLNFHGCLQDLFFLLMDDEKILYCDSDSVLTGPVLELIDTTKTFFAITGKWMDMGDKRQLESYERNAIDLELLPRFCTSLVTEKLFFVMGCHFFVRPREFPVDELYRCLPEMEYGVGEKFYHERGPRPSTVFKRGDQGFFCYVLNRYFVGTDDFERRSGVVLECHEDSRKKHSFSWEDVKLGNANIGFIHFVGYSRKRRLNNHLFGDVLLGFYQQYWTILGRSSLSVDFRRWFGVFLLDRAKAGFRRILKVVTKR